ncbi:hypothetical protein [Bradyrhizobium sp. BR 1432]|uniref:hypothetical protein n=1 Tax=Bradyrhizobium sp. BR 1432 TaxID=3447966 RepID=UPI003EE7DAE8
MTNTANGGLPEAAAKPVSGGKGQDFNDMLRCGADPSCIVDIVENGDVPPHERIAGWIESDDDSDVMDPLSEAGGAPEGEQGGAGAAVDAPKASPRSWGFDVGNSTEATRWRFGAVRHWW